jgi:hypothetical protein
MTSASAATGDGSRTGSEVVAVVSAVDAPRLEHLEVQRVEHEAFDETRAR